MKKVAAIMFSLVMVSAMLSGCYSTACSTPEQPVMKDVKPADAAKK
jgi:predicted small secreted protein